MVQSIRELQCTCYRLRKATRAVTGAYDAALAPVGLTSTQFSVLAVVASGEFAASMSQLADVLGMDISSLSRTLRPLVAAGHLESVGGQDRRIRRIAVTGSGRKLAAKAVPLWRSAQARVEQAVGADLSEFHILLERLGTGMSSRRQA